MNDCHDCRYHLNGEKSPYHRCLIFYGQGIAKEMLKDGLIGRCDEHKGILHEKEESPNAEVSGCATAEQSNGESKT